MASDPVMRAGHAAFPQAGASELVAGDLLSEDSMPHLLPDPANLHSPTAATVSLHAGAALQVADLLDAGGAGLSGEGGFLVFDHQSHPGTTIVRVMLEGADHHQLFEIGTLHGGVTDLDSLLGLITPDTGLG